MARKADTKKSAEAGDTSKERLEAALNANLARRKAQARARAAEAAAHSTKPKGGT